MKKSPLLLLGCLVFFTAFSQDSKQKIERACLNYIEGFYEGDTSKLVRSLTPSGVYEPDGNMTYRQAIDYAKNVLAKKNFAKEGSPKKIEILDISHSIASAKVTAWWGIDYILLAKHGENWMIEQVLWEGPPEKN